MRQWRISSTSFGRTAGSMLEPVTRRRNAPNERIASAANSFLDKSRASNSVSMKLSLLGILAVNSAGGLRGVDFAAGQRHGFEHLLVMERGLEIGLFWGVAGYGNHWNFRLIGILLFTHGIRTPMCFASDSNDNEICHWMMHAVSFRLPRNLCPTIVQSPSWKPTGRVVRS